MFTATGVITYEPKRRMKDASKWWCTVELPRFYGTMDYYRWYIERNWYDADIRTLKRVYQRPSHPPHISVNRGEEPRRNDCDWGKYLSGKKVKVHYSNLIRQTDQKRDGKDNFWFLDCQVKELVGIRQHFGLDWQRNGVPFKGHITIAKVM